MRLDPGLRAELAAAGSDAAREALCDRLADHPGVAEARRRALAFVSEARAAVTDGPTDGADVAALVEIADGVVDRYS
jgi:geranylgeranyl pyrophosphate synthase